MKLSRGTRVQICPCFEKDVFIRLFGSPVGLKKRMLIFLPVPGYRETCTRVQRDMTILRFLGKMQLILLYPGMAKELHM
jgi:hypothetical protein